MTVVALGLGSNLGDKLTNINRAIELLDNSEGINVTTRSKNYRTEPWGIKEQDWFINVCVLIETSLDAKKLLKICLEIEQKLGRIRETKWGSRIIDIDILVYGEHSISMEGLTIPHPHIQERSFVLVPLAEIWPDATVNGETITKLLQKRTDTNEIQLFGNMNQFHDK